MKSGTKETQPLLALRAGRYREFAPSPALRQHFTCLWSHEAAANLDRPVAIVPDGYCDLVSLGTQLFVTGPDRTSAFPRIPAGARIIGARFAPGAANAWLRLPLSDIVGCSVPLLDIGMPGVADIEARLRECAQDQQRMPLLHQWLEETARNRPTPIAESALIFDTMNARAAPNRIAFLRQSLEISESQLRRRCHQYFGYGAKTLERIRRFQHFMALCRHGRGVSLSRLALEAGFADQAHMTREIGDLSSLTPATMLSQLRPTDRFVQDAKYQAAMSAGND